MLQEANNAAVPKKAYVQPTLTEFGAVAKLSQSGASTGTENGPHPTRKSCL